MACFVHGSCIGLRLRSLRGNVARVFCYTLERDQKPLRSVFSVASHRATERPMPSSLSWGRYCIRTATASRRYGTDSEAGKIYRSLELSPDGKKLCVSWADGEESTYHAVWLRHNCRCPQCWDDSNSGHKVHFSSLRNVEIKTIELSGDILTVRWGYCDSTEEHTGYLPLHYMKKHSYSASALQRRRDAERPVVADHMPTMAYPDIVSDEKYQWMWLKNLNLYGVCLLTDMPCEEDEVVKLGDMAGGAEATIFTTTPIFTVDVKDTPEDIADSDSALPYHVDLSGWKESPPGLTVLHCIRFDDCIEGGETLVVDVFPVLEELREKHPKQFEILSTVPASHQRKIAFQHGKMVAMERRRPHIIVDGDGEITAFYTSPTNGAPLFTDEENVEAYFDAFCLMQEMLTTSKYQHTLRLQPEQALTISNRRCVHSRTAFKANGGQRFFQGTVVDSDNLKSAMRIMAEKYEPDFVLKRTFNLDPL